MSWRWESSGSTKQTKECHGKFDWLHLKTVRISPYMYEWKTRKALKINKLRTINEMDKNFKNLNRGNGDYVTKSSWKPLLMLMGNHQTAPYDVNIIVTFQFENVFLTAKPKYHVKIKKILYLVFCPWKSVLELMFLVLREMSYRNYPLNTLLKEYSIHRELHIIKPGTAEHGMPEHQI